MTVMRGSGAGRLLVAGVPLLLATMAGGCMWQGTGGRNDVEGRETGSVECAEEDSGWSRPKAVAADKR